MVKVTNYHFPESRLFRRQFKCAKKLWITRGILTSAKHQNKLYLKCKKSLNENDFKTYKFCRNTVTRAKDAAKAMYFQKLIRKSDDSSMTWKAINKILRKGELTFNAFPSRINVKGKTLSDSSEICHELNQYFCGIGLEMA